MMRLATEARLSATISAHSGGDSACSAVAKRSTILLMTRKAVPKAQQDALEHICGKWQQWSSNWTTGSGQTRSGCQPVRQDNTMVDPHTIHLRVLCSVRCACFHTHNLQHNQRWQSPTATKPFVCAYLFLACVRHAPTCACPSCAHARHLHARALPMPETCVSLVYLHLYVCFWVCLYLHVWLYLLLPLPLSPGPSWPQSIIFVSLSIPLPLNTSLPAPLFYVFQYLYHCMCFLCQIMLSATVSAICVQATGENKRTIGLSWPPIKQIRILSVKFKRWIINYIIG